MITLYSTPTCKGCHEMKAWLKERNLEYVDGDVNQMAAKTGVMYVPTLDWDGEIVVGFNQRELNAIYNKKNPKG